MRRLVLLPHLLLQQIILLSFVISSMTRYFGFDLLYDIYSFIFADPASGAIVSVARKVGQIKAHTKIVTKGITSGVVANGTSILPPPLV